MDYLMKLTSNFTVEQLALTSYVVVISLTGFILMAIDKSKSKKGEWRVREATLLAIAFLGGSIGVIMGMLIFKHKTNKKKFRLGVPIVYILNRIISIVFLALLK